MDARTLRADKRKCSICGRSFSKTEHLERHIRSHTKEKPFQCQSCDRRYGRNDSLLRHIKDQHRTSPDGGQFQSRAVSNGQPSIDAPSNGQNMHMNHSGTTMTTESDIPSPYISIDNINSNEPSTWTTVQESTHLSQSEAYPEDILASYGYEAFLTYENLDSILRNWPFDEAELDHAIVSDNEKSVTDLHQTWYTYLDKDDLDMSTCPTPSRQRQEVDESYRQSLHRRLQIRVLDQKLPSSQYLNLCVAAYFKRFHPIFPVVHAATFRPSSTNAVLLLSVCSIGSLLTGHPNAVQIGVQLFERLNKAILSNWEKLMRRGADETFAMTQAALIGQTFGLLSGQPKHLILVETFSGTIIAWARRAKLFQITHQETEVDLKSRWQSWARTEEKIRVALAVRIHDTEIADTLHQETFLTSSSKRGLLADSDASFFASNAQDWAAIHQPGVISESSDAFQRLLSMPIDCYFSIYCALEDVLATVIEARVIGISDQYVQKVSSYLIMFQQRNFREEKSFRVMFDGIKVLWHFIYISLHSDLDLLEKCIGREGSKVSPSDLAEVRQWARSNSARQSAVHALMIKRQLERFSLISEPAIHVPRVLFASAIILYCYAKHGDGSAVQNLHLPELQSLDIEVSTVIREIECRKEGDAEFGAVYAIIDILQRVGHWGISRKFASILSALVYVDAH